MAPTTKPPLTNIARFNPTASASTVADSEAPEIPLPRGKLSERLRQAFKGELV
jgi:hypothetical protein